MRVLITIQHPAHVHFFRNAIREMESKGHDIRVLVREKDITTRLLESYNIDYNLVTGKPRGLFGILGTQIKYELGILRETIRFSPDVMTAIMEPSVAHASKLTNIPSVLFADTEHATLQNSLAHPFADEVCTPECYQQEVNNHKHTKYPGYHELAYLHPDRFEPDKNVLVESGLDPDEKIALIRLVAWDAVHDRGDSGFYSIQDVVSQLEEAGAKVLITSEEELPRSVSHCCIDIPPEKIHDLMYYADLYIGESATMATESAVLGTPAIFVSSSRRGYTDELENKHGIVYNYSGRNRHDRGVEKAVNILTNYSEDEWNDKRSELLSSKIDVTSFILDKLESKCAK